MAALAALDGGPRPASLGAVEASVRQGQDLLAQIERLRAACNGGATSLVADGVMNEGIISTRLGLSGIPNAAEDVMIARDLFLASTVRFVPGSRSRGVRKSLIHPSRRMSSAAPASAAKGSCASICRTTSAGCRCRSNRRKVIVILPSARLASAPAVTWPEQGHGSY